MTTELIIIHLFCLVDTHLGKVKKDKLAKLHPSEVVTIGILYALKGGTFSAFCRWLKRDYDALFGGLPDRSTLLRQLARQARLTDRLLAAPTFFCVMDSLPIEMLFPIREGRSPKQVGKKGKDKGRWSVGVKLAWLMNSAGQVCDWRWDSLNVHDQTFLELAKTVEAKSVVLADYGFRCAEGMPDNVKLCAKGTWNERMQVETAFSLLTVVCRAKTLFHRQDRHIEAHFGYLTAMFNVCQTLFQHLLPQLPPVKPRPTKLSAVKRRPHPLCLALFSL